MSQPEKKASVTNLDPRRARLKKKLRFKSKVAKALEDERALAAGFQEKAQKAFDAEAAPLQDEQKGLQERFAALQKQVEGIKQKHANLLGKKLAPVQEKAVKLAKLLDKTESAIEELTALIKGEDDDDDLDAQLAKLDPPAEPEVQVANDEVLTPDEDETYPDDQPENETEPEDDDDLLAGLGLDD